MTELLEGETLRQRIQSRPVPARRATDYALQIVRGLVAAHGKSVLHRDLKPENIFLTSDGRIEILDFGVGEAHAPRRRFRQCRCSNRRLANRRRSRVGSGAVAYISPEQVRGKPADTRSDLFSVGAILYEMVSGKRAFRGDTAADAMSAIGCEQDGGLDLAKYLHLGRTGQLAEGVAHKNRARYLSRNRLPECGRMAVTPVRTSPPRMMVVCPTSTPATSVIASSGPVGRMPIFSKSEARGRAFEGVFCAITAAVASKATTAARILLIIAPDYICGSQPSLAIATTAAITSCPVVHPEAIWTCRGLRYRWSRLAKQ